jgi:cell volume regulation protein A
VVAKWLKVNLPAGEKKRHPLDEFMDEPKNALLEEVLVKPHHSISGKKIIDLEFPTSAIIAMIQRDGQYLTPNGATKIETNDKLYILASSKQGMDEVKLCFVNNRKADRKQAKKN